MPAPGRGEVYSLYRSTADGTWYQNPRHEISYDTAIGETEFIMYPVQGDKVSNYYYSRSGGRITQDVPRMSYDSWKDQDNGTVYNDMRYSKSLVPQAGLARAHTQFTEESNDEARAITQALNGLVPNAAQTGASIGEGAQTANMFLSSARTLISAASNAARGSWGGVLRDLGIGKDFVFNSTRLASRWLEVEFGWKPLMQDIYQTQQKLHEEFRTGSLVRASSTSSSDDKFGYVYNGLRYDTTCSSSVRCVLIAVIERSGLRATNSWGLLNPLSVAWELVPFSFVVDWAMPIGNTLSALTSSAGLGFRGGFVNRRRKWTHVCNGLEVPPFNSGGFASGVTQLGQCSWEGFYFERRPLSAFPLPQIYVTNPFLGKDGGLKTNRLIDSLALLRQMT